MITKGMTVKDIFGQQGKFLLNREIPQILCLSDSAALKDVKRYNCSPAIFNLFPLLRKGNFSFGCYFA